MDDPRAGLETAIAERRQARQRERARERRRKVLTWMARVLAAGLLLFAGVAIGRAIEEAPRPGGTQTRLRTIEPATSPPVTRTVTVTTAGS
jgi:hypothetical protein